jgi:hypothetical protein
MSSSFRFATCVGAAISAATLTFHLSTNAAQSEPKRPVQAAAIPANADNRPAFSEGFVGMVGNTPLVILLGRSNCAVCVAHRN